MELFTASIESIREFIRNCPDVKTLQARYSCPWPEGGGRNIVLMNDVGVELGGPETESYSLLLWTGDATLIHNGAITLIGPDLAEAGSRSVAFGKIVLLSIEGFTEENTYQRYREMEQMRFLLDLKGYMVRAVSQYRKEWSRVSKDALENGFSLPILGSSLMKMFRDLDYVTGMEIIFITQNANTIGEIRNMTGDTYRIIAAMNKMVEEMNFDCSSCEYRDICNDAEYLRKMRDAYLKKQEGDTECRNRGS